MTIGAKKSLKSDDELIKNYNDLAKLHLIGRIKKIKL